MKWCRDQKCTCDFIAWHFCPQHHEIRKKAGEIYREAYQITFTELKWRIRFLPDWIITRISAIISSKERCVLCVVNLQKMNWITWISCRWHRSSQEWNSKRAELQYQSGRISESISDRWWSSDRWFCFGTCTKKFYNRSQKLPADCYSKRRN